MKYLLILILVSCKNYVPKKVAYKVEHSDTCGYNLYNGDTAWIVDCTTIFFKPETKRDSALLNIDTYYDSSKVDTTMKPMTLRHLPCYPSIMKCDYCTKGL